jgi:hypothetical protein
MLWICRAAVSRGGRVAGGALCCCILCVVLGWVGVAGFPSFLLFNPCYKWWVRVRLPALPDFLRSSGSGTGSIQPREYLKEKVAAPV